MPHKMAVKSALELLGGKAQLKQIYPIAIKLIGDNTLSKDIRATIRRELNSSPMYFKPTPGKEGWWELVSYQEELAVRDDKINELMEEIARRKAEESKSDFVKRMLKVAISLYKHDTAKLDIIRQLMFNLGCTEIEKILDEMISGKEVPVFSHVGDIVLKKETNIDKNYAPNIDNHNGGMVKLPEQISEL